LYVKKRKEEEEGGRLQTHTTFLCLHELAIKAQVMATWEGGQVSKLGVCEGLAPVYQQNTRQKVAREKKKP
jgi:hypothetical protein